MPQIVICRGLPASGKTTYAKQWVAESPTTRARSNRDDLRQSLFGTEGVLPFADEQVITTVQQASVKALLASGKDVIVDDTNLRLKFARAWADLAAKAGARFEVNDNFLSVPVDVCVERDETRYIRGGRYVTEDVIRSIHSKFRPDRGLPAVTASATVNSTGGYQYMPDVSLPDAVLVDIDGTALRMTDRGPYDFHLYHADVANEPVAQVIRDYWEAGKTIVYGSGRDDTYYTETMQSLKGNGLWWDERCELNMRPNAKEPAKGPKRNDAVVKVEMFRELVAPRFNVLFALDDRDRVVKAYRTIGLTVLQVAPGDF